MKGVVLAGGRGLAALSAEAGIEDINVVTSGQNWGELPARDSVCSNRGLVALLQIEYTNPRTSRRRIPDRPLLQPNGMNSETSLD